jgi:hypothetical protein
VDYCEDCPIPAATENLKVPGAIEDGGPDGATRGLVDVPQLGAGWDALEEFEE